MEVRHPLLVDGVPYVYVPVAAAASKRPKGFVEREGVDREHGVYTARLCPVALERVALLLHLLGEVKVFDRDPALDRADGKALCVGEALDGTGLVLERRLALLDGAVQLAVEVEHDDLAPGERRHELGAHHRHGEDLAGDVALADASGTAEVPEADGAVPAAAGDDGGHRLGGRDGRDHTHRACVDADGGDAGGVDVK